MFITKTIFYKQSINYCHLATGKQMSRGFITQFAFRYHVDEELFQFTQKNIGVNMLLVQLLLCS